MGRLLGVDYGNVRCGVALSDPFHIIASAHSVIRWTQSGVLLRELAQICEEQEVEQIVVGLPLNMDGSRGPMAQKVDEFVEALKGKVSLPVVTWDERLTTKTAEKALIEAGTRRAKRKDLIDKVAAQVLLQAYIDAHP